MIVVASNAIIVDGSILSSLPWVSLLAMGSYSSRGELTVATQRPTINRECRTCLRPPSISYATRWVATSVLWQVSICQERVVLDSMLQCHLPILLIWLSLAFFCLLVGIGRVGAQSTGVAWMSRKEVDIWSSFSSSELNLSCRAIVEAGIGVFFHLRASSLHNPIA